MKKIWTKVFSLFLTVIMIGGLLSTSASADETAVLVEANIVTEVLDWGETITAIRIEYSEEIACDAVEYSVEYANTMTYDMVTDRDIVNIYVNNSGKKDDIQLKGRYVFINLGIVNEDFTTYRDQVAFDTGARTRHASNPYYLYQSAPITTVSGKVIPRRTITTSGEIRVGVDDFQTFTYENDETDTFLNYHLYIPEGYDTKDDALADLPLIVHYPSGDYYYADYDGLYKGALFSHPDAVVWASEEAQEQQKAFVVTVGGERSTTWNAKHEDSVMQQNYIAIQQLLLEEYNIDANRLYAVSLAGGSVPMWNTLLAYPNFYAAQLSTAYEPYHAFGDVETAEVEFGKIMDDMPGWYFTGLTDRSGAGSLGADDTRIKGHRMLDFADRMSAKGYNIDIGYGEAGEQMWNGMLRGKPAEALAQEQVERAAASGADHLVTFYIPGTVLQSMHWSWNASYSNAVVREWLYSQTKGNHNSGPGGPGVDVPSRYPKAPVPTGEAAELVEAKLYTQVLDWGETITAVRLEYSDEISCDAIEYSTEYSDRVTYKMISDRDIVNLYVNNSGKKDDIQVRGKYVFLNLGTVNHDYTTYRDQVTFLTKSQTRPDPNPYYIYQSVPIITTSGKTIEGGSIVTSGEIREDIDNFETFTYTNPATGNWLNYHLYIPEGYEAKKDNLDDLPLVVHFPSTDYVYEDGGRYLGTLFTHPDATVWASDKAQAANKAFVVTVGGPRTAYYPDVEYEDSEMQQNYLRILKLLAYEYNIDLSRIYAVSLAGGTKPMWNTILNNPGVFAAEIDTSLDPYSNYRSIERGEDEFAKILDELPGWHFMGMTDRPGSYVHLGEDDRRTKGERYIDCCKNLIAQGYNIEIGYGEEGELMWNGLLRGEKAEALALEQMARAEAAGADHMLTLYTPGTLLQTMHWSWTAAYSNAAVRGWLFDQVNDNPTLTPEGPDPIIPPETDPETDLETDPATELETDPETNPTTEPPTDTPPTQKPGGINNPDPKSTDGKGSGKSSTGGKTTTTTTTPRTGDTNSITAILLLLTASMSMGLIVIRKRKNDINRG